MGSVCSPVVRVEALRARLDEALFPLSVCPAPKERVAEASEALALTEDQCTACVGVHSSALMQPKVTSLPLFWSSLI